MENPDPSLIVNPISAPLSAELIKLTFRSLYIRRAGPGSRETYMDGNSGLGARYFSDFPVYDGTGSDAKLVARVQGLSIQAGETHQVFTIVFETERLKGSTLLTSGVLTKGPANMVTDEWAIYGGTGVFGMANGFIRRTFISAKDRTDELKIKVFCPDFVLSRSKQVQGSITKVGLYGGKGGSAKDITVAPKRLQSLTIRSANAIDSIQFTYTDKAGHQHTAGPWGGSGGTPQTIDLWHTEYVKEVLGTIGNYGDMTFLSSLKLVTSSRTLGPWGNKDAGTPFCITAPANSSIVGFYGRSGGLIDAIGVYVREFGTAGDDTDDSMIV